MPDDTNPNRLAVYGMFAPGKENHWVLQGLKGTWTSGKVRAYLYQQGFGDSDGFPTIKCDENAPEIAVQVFESDELPAHWKRIDEFDGREYRRTLVPVTFADGMVRLCFIYALNEE